MIRLIKRALRWLGLPLVAAAPPAPRRGQRMRIKRPGLVGVLCGGITLGVAVMTGLGYLALKYGEGIQMRPNGVAPWDQPWSPGLPWSPPKPSRDTTPGPPIPGVPMPRPPWGTR